MMAATVTSIIVPIQGTFDIAQARNSLRLKIALWRCPLALNARAATAVTAFGELILSLEKPQPVLVRIAIIDPDEAYGIDISANFRVTGGKPPQWESRLRNLERAATDIKIHESGDDIEITASVRIK